MPSGIIFANKLAKKHNIPLVCGVHCSDIEVLTNPLYKFYFKKQLEDAYKNAKKIACRSFILQKKFNKLMPELAEKTFVACSGLKQEGRKVGRQEGKPAFLPSYLPALQILACGNLIKRKNIDKLILAIQELEGFELKIIGDGKELNNLKNLLPRPLQEGVNDLLNDLSPRPLQEREEFRHEERVSEIRVRGNIEFLGRLPHEKVLEEMQKSDIFILPSVNETFGMVCLEAMASGCITVCTKNDGIDGIIKDGENGFLCEPTVKGIKETLLKIKNEGNLEQIRHKALETVKEYSQQNCAKKYINNL